MRIFKICREHIFKCSETWDMLIQIIDFSKTQAGNICLRNNNCNFFFLSFFIQVITEEIKFLFETHYRRIYARYLEIQIWFIISGI